MNNNFNKILIGSINKRITELSQLSLEDFSFFNYLYDHRVRFDFDYDEKSGITNIYSINTVKGKLDKIISEYKLSRLIEKRKAVKNQEIDLSSSSIVMIFPEIASNKDDEKIDEIIDFFIKESREYKEAIIFQTNYPEAKYNELDEMENTYTEIINCLTLQEQIRLKFKLQEYIDGRRPMTQFQRIYFNSIIHTLEEKTSETVPVVYK